MSDLVIKDYKYVSGNLPDIQKRGQIIRDEIFPDVELPIFIAREKKAVIRSTQHQLEPSVSSNMVQTAIGVAPHQVAESSPKTFLHNQKSHAVPVVEDMVESRLKKETHIAFQQGFQDGRAQGIAEWNSRAQNISDSFHKALEQIGDQFKHYSEEIEKSVTELSLHLAEKVIGEAAHKMQDVVKTNFAKCAALLAGSGKVVVKINPSDYESIKTFLPAVSQQYEGKFAFVIEPDQNITNGGCVVELDGSMIDARIETQLANIKNHMQMLS